MNMVTPPSDQRYFFGPVADGAVEQTAIFGASLVWRGAEPIAPHIRLAYFRSHILSSTSYTDEVHDTSGAVTTVGFTRSDEAIITTVLLDALARYSGKSWYVLAGLTAIVRTSSTWNADLHIDAPATYTFPQTGTQTEALLSSAIPSLQQIGLAATIGAGYDIPLGDRLTFSPEATYSLPFSSMIASYGWTEPLLRVGASMRYGWGK